jgi:hypothetical protein
MNSEVYLEIESRLQIVNDEKQTHETLLEAKNLQIEKLDKTLDNEYARLQELFRQVDEFKGMMSTYDQREN